MSTFSTVGKYRVVEEIGRGGMGAVYKCYDPFLDRTVAIKLLAPHLVWEKDFVERFLREARAAARLRHPNIVEIHDVGQDGSNYYFVMTYLPGPSLKERITQKGRLAPAEILLVLRQLADALDYAHSKGLVHRDVKPANVMFDERGQAVLMDFGIVKAAQESKLTVSGTPIGTPHYMAPEHIQGTGVNARIDEYALGIIAFEMLTGRVPFDADSTTAILYKHVNEPPPSVTACCPDLPSSIEAVLNRALSKSPADRYPTCGEFVSALEQMLALTREPQPTPPTIPVHPEPTPVPQLPPTASPVTSTSKTGGIGSASPRPPSRSLPPGLIAGGAGTALVILTLVVLTFSGVLGGTRPFPAVMATPVSTLTSVPVTPVEPPSSTPIVIVVTATSKPVVEPSATPLPQPTASPTPTPLKSGLATTIPSSQVVQPQPESPPLGGGPYSSPIYLKWQGSLNAGQLYQVTVYLVGSGNAGTVLGKSGLLTTPGWCTNLGMNIGEVRWRVSVMSNGKEAAVSQPAHFYVSPLGKSLSPPCSTGTTFESPISH